WEVDLSQTIIMLTANYWDRVPDFVRSRCKRVNIQLLSFKERMDILRNRRDAFVREYFPSNIVGKEAINGIEIKYDEDEYNKNHEPNTFTEEQQKIRERVNDDFLRMCITEEFGIRGGIMNLVSAFNFLITFKVRKLLDKMPYLDQPTGNNSPYKNGKWFNVSQEGEGTLNLNYEVNGKNYLLALTQKRDVEEIKAVKKEAVAGYEKAEEKDTDETIELIENLFKPDYLEVKIKIGIQAEINYQPNPKQFYLMKKFLRERIKKERLDLVVNFRKQRIITPEEYNDTDIDDDFDRYDCVLLECKVCGVEYSESMGHECMEPEKEPDEFEDNDPDSYETIYCEPTCPNCGRDENECVGRCDDSEEMEPEPIEEEFEPSADFC
ncbi:2925_t:CDS:2, partial [Racocetra persica]